MLWLSCRDQIDVWKLFSDIFFLVLSLIDKDSWLQHQLTLEQRKLRASHHSCCRAFWSKLKKKNPKIVVMSPTATAKNSKQKEIIWQQYRLCLAVAEYQIRGGKHFLIFGPESGKIWWLKKGQYLQKKYHCRWTLLRGKKPRWTFHNFGNLSCPLELEPASRERVVPTEWQVRTVLFEILNSAVPGDMQVADRVSTAGPREDFTTFCPPLSQQGVREYMRAVRWPNTHCHVHTQLGLQSALLSSSVQSSIWSPWLTRFRYGDHSLKHDKASQSITKLNLKKNQIGDDGARA